MVYPNVTMLTPTRKPGRNFFQREFFEGTYPYLTAKKSCGYLSPVPRYGPPNFANFRGLAPQNFWRNGTPCFLLIRKANGSAVCVQNFSCRLDTAPEIWGIIFDHPPKKAVFGRNNDFNAPLRPQLFTDRDGSFREGRWADNKQV